MKNLIVFSLLIFVSFVAAKAQSFYSPKDISVKVHNGSLDAIGVDPNSEENILVNLMATKYSSGAGASVTLSFLRDNNSFILSL